VLPHDKAGRDKNFLIVFKMMREIWTTYFYSNLHVINTIFTTVGMIHWYKAVQQY
jgi:hypothetical protein